MNWRTVFLRLEVKLPRPTWAQVGVIAVISLAGGAAVLLVLASLFGAQERAAERDECVSKLHTCLNPPTPTPTSRPTPTPHVIPEGYSYSLPEVEEIAIDGLEWQVWSTDYVPPTDMVIAYNGTYGNPEPPRIYLFGIDGQVKKAWHVKNKPGQRISDVRFVPAYAGDARPTILFAMGVEGVVRMDTAGDLLLRWNAEPVDYADALGAGAKILTVSSVCNCVVLRDVASGQADWRWTAEDSRIGYAQHLEELGTYLVTLPDTDTVVEINEDSNPIWSFGEYLLKDPRMAHMSSHGTQLVVYDAGHERIVAFNRATQAVEWEAPVHGDLWEGQLVMLPDGNIAISDVANTRVQILSPEGEKLWAVGPNVLLERGEQ